MRATDQKSVQVQPAHAIWLLSMFCTLYQKPIDPHAVARECIPPLTLEDFSHIAGQLGLAVEVAHADLKSGMQPLPLIVQAASSTPTGQEAVEHEWLVLLQLEGADVVASQFGHKALQRKISPNCILD